jgi:hypothetical protein
VYLLIPPINFRIPEPIFMKLVMYIMTSEPILTAYLINPSRQSVCLYVYLSYRCYAKARYSAALISLLGNGLVNTFPWRRIHALLDTCVCGSICAPSYRC